MFQVVTVAFLPVGHTHADYDQAFVPMTYELRKSTVSCLTDFLAAIYAAYKGLMNLLPTVTVIDSVPNYRAWFEPVGDKHFKGYGSGGKEIDRVHFYQFEKGDAGSAPMRTKNFSSDADWWTLPGETEPRPANILVDTPDDKPQPTLDAEFLQKFAAQRPFVEMNHAATNLVTDEAKAENQKMYDAFCDSEGKTTDESIGAFFGPMEASYTWSKLPSFVYVSKEIDAAKANAEHRKMLVPPIKHAGFTDVEHARAVENHPDMRHARSEELDLAAAEQAIEDQDKTNAEVQVVVSLLQAGKEIPSDTNTTVVTFARDIVDREARVNSATPLHRVEEISIVGAVNISGYDKYYLLHWLQPEHADAGNGNEYTWEPQHEIKKTATFEACDMENEEICVWWGPEKGKVTQAAEYVGVANSVLGNNVALQISYQDSEVETIDAHSLSFIDSRSEEGGDNGIQSHEGVLSAVARFRLCVRRMPRSDNTSVTSVSSRVHGCAYCTRSICFIMRAHPWGRCSRNKANKSSSYLLTTMPATFRRQPRAPTR